MCFVLLSLCLKELDPFAHLKKEAFNVSKEMMDPLAVFTVGSYSIPNDGDTQLEQHFFKLLEVYYLLLLFCEFRVLIISIMIFP